MVKVGVKLPPASGRIGDFLADVTALEAAGADSVWLPAGNASTAEPWILLGAIAGAAHRVRLGTMVDSAAGCAPALHSLARLTGGRVVVGISPGPDLRQSLELLRIPSSSQPGPQILITCRSRDEAEQAMLLADGVTVPGGDEVVRELRASQTGDSDFELWAEISIPPDRAGWVQTMSAYEAAGATGIILSWDPRIVDLLRSAGEQDDRTDLLIATG